MTSRDICRSRCAIGVAVLRLGGDDREDQQIERALREVGLFGRHDTSSFDTYIAPARVEAQGIEHIALSRLLQMSPQLRMRSHADWDLHQALQRDG